MAKLCRYLLTLAILPFACAANVHAATVYLKASLDGAQAGTASTADGSAFITYDTTSRLLTWTANYRNLTNTLVAAHFHGPAPRGVEGAVQIPIATTASPIQGSAALTPAQEADLLAGLYYVNLHTLNYTNGEIRGQVQVIDTNFYDVFAGPAGGSFATDFLRGTVSLDPATLTMSWAVAYGVTSTPVAAGFAGPARTTEQAPATIGTALAPNPIAGSRVLSPAQAAELVNGFWYFAVAPVIRAQVLPSHPRLANISTRARVLTGNNVVIAGFIVGGSASKTVAVVATGPSLASAGITNPLGNPKITLVRSSDQSVLATNDEWRNQANGQGGVEFRATGFAPTNDREAAIMATLAPGAYTAIVQGADGGSGVGLVAVYEVDRPDVPLVNMSTRAEVLTGDDVVIGGFIIQGNTPKTVVVTGTGPSLGASGIANPLANPALLLVRSSDQAIIAANDDWPTAANAADIQAAGFAPANPLEPAIMVTLPPGAYTAILLGSGGVTGVGIVAVYAVQ